jgi:hypothetical protein
LAGSFSAKVLAIEGRSASIRHAAWLERIASIMRVCRAALSGFHLIFARPELP